MGRRSNQSVRISAAMEKLWRTKWKNRRRKKK